LSKEIQDAFDLIKSKISFAPVLAYPDRDLPFMVETNNSNFATVYPKNLPKTIRSIPLLYFQDQYG